MILYNLIQNKQLTDRVKFILDLDFWKKIKFEIRWVSLMLMVQTWQGDDEVT